MPRTWPAMVIDDICKQVVQPVLKPAGYRRNRRTWTRAVNDVVQLINVQASAYNAGDAGQFALNAGVYVPAAHPYLWSMPRGTVVAESLCFARHRPASRAFGGDHWWSFEPGTDLARIGAEVRSVLIEHALPYLAPLDSLAALVAAPGVIWPVGGLERAVCLYLLGDVPAAVETLAQAIDRHRRRGLDEWLVQARQEYVLEIAARLGPEVREAVRERADGG